MGNLDRWGHIIFAGKEAKPDDKDIVAAQQALAKMHMAIASAHVVPDVVPAAAPINTTPWQWRGMHVVADSSKPDCGIPSLKKSIPVLAGMGIRPIINPGLVELDVFQANGTLSGIRNRRIMINLHGQIEVAGRQAGRAFFWAMPGILR